MLHYWRLRNLVDMSTAEKRPNIQWNSNVKLVVSDVDETIADNYTVADPRMTRELNSVLSDGVVLFMASGASLARINSRIVDSLKPELRRQVLVAHCSGAEVWGYDKLGKTNQQPFYSAYEGLLNTKEKETWRDNVATLVSEFKLDVHPPLPIADFQARAKNNPLAVMVEDRGPQITIEVPNGYDLSKNQLNDIGTDVPETHGRYDLRVPVLRRAEELFNSTGLPITPRLAGIWAVDFAIKGVNKTTAIKQVLGDKNVLDHVGLSLDIPEDPSVIEIWGDRFSVLRGGTDRHMSEALPKLVRSIDFREEDPSEFLPGYNTVLWDGAQHLHKGLLEYLTLRHRIP